MNHIGAFLKEHPLITTIIAGGATGAGLYWGVPPGMTEKALGVISGFFGL